MSSNAAFTKENLNTYLKELAKEFRKLNGTKMPAELILIGGAAILANYGFREVTYDIEAVIRASSVMKDAVNCVGDRLGLPNGWLNMDFIKTSSYSSKLSEVSVYYRTFSNILTVRTVSAEYLIAMKLMSCRQYKNDLSDIVGILWEHEKIGKPISLEAIHKAVFILYGDTAVVPANAKKFIDDAFQSGDYERVYAEIRESERQSKNILLDFNKKYPKALKEENIEIILEQEKKKQQGEHN
ncbi:MAG: hypothetical protein LBS74_07725 [Oscillospiraceae bacterium]|jgi:hypothetical protein|nr:hypothetical protein [Oscillospiraceae bacterium]